MESVKSTRADLGRFVRRTAKTLGLQVEGPVLALHGKPESARTVDRERSRDAEPSQPVLPRSHPLLEVTPIRYPETWVQSYQGLKVYGPTISVVDANDRFLADVSVEWGRKPEENWTFRRFHLPKPKRVTGKTLVLASTGGNTYFHWITDILPRIRLAREAGYLPGSFDHILVNGLDQPFQERTLETLGIPKDKCLVFAEGESAWQLEEAILPSLPGVPGVVPRESVDFLRREFAVPASKVSQRIFIGRGGAKHRNLVHEEEISRELGKKGFEKVDCGNLSVLEQARIFASAGMIVGAHGAALTNLVFCRPGTKVIELFSPRYVNPCYRDLCLAADLRHTAVIGDGEDWVLSAKHDKPSAVITASWRFIEEMLDIVDGAR